MVYEAMEPMGRPGLNFLIYSAEPGSPTEERLRLLASWAAPDAAETRPEAAHPTPSTKEPRA
jgi:hypothetical protein